MKIRVVQIWGFLLTVLGWIFVACTMAMEGWKISSVGGQGGSSILKVAWYWSSLWRSCFTDSTAVSNCKDFPVLWSVEGYVQIVRGLLMSALSLGMLGFILSLFGMECTHIGGTVRSKHKKIYVGGLCHIISGGLSTSGYAVYAQYVSVDFFSPDFITLRFDLGTPVFLGWVGSAFHVAGGFFHLWSVCRPLCGGEAMVVTLPAQPDPEHNKSITALSTASDITSKTKLSSISELSSTSQRSDVSSIASRSERTSRSGRSTATSRTVPSTRSAGSSRSGSGSELQSLMSSQSREYALWRSTPSASRTASSPSPSASRTASSPSPSWRSQTKTSYI